MCLAGTGIGFLQLVESQTRPTGDWNFLRTLEVDRSACYCQMNMIDSSLIAMRREIRVYWVYLSTSK